MRATRALVHRTQQGLAKATGHASARQSANVTKRPAAQPAQDCSVLGDLAQHTQRNTIEQPVQRLMQAVVDIGARQRDCRERVRPRSKANTSEFGSFGSDSCSEQVGAPEEPQARRDFEDNGLLDKRHPRRELQRPPADRVLLVWGSRCRRRRPGGVEFGAAPIRPLCAGRRLHEQRHSKLGGGHDGDLRSKKNDPAAGGGRSPEGRGPSAASQRAPHLCV